MNDVFLFSWELPVDRSVARKIYVLLPGSFGAIFTGRFVQPQPFRFLNLNDVSVMHDDFHHAVTQRADLLDDQLQPSQIFIPANRQFIL